MHEVQPYIRGRRRLGSLHLSLDDGVSCCKCQGLIRQEGRAALVWTAYEMQWKIARNCETHPEQVTTKPLLEKVAPVQPKPKRKVKWWTAREDDIIRQSNLEGLSGRAIAKLLPGRSKQSVIARAGRIGNPLTPKRGGWAKKN